METDKMISFNKRVWSKSLNKTGSGQKKMVSLQGYSWETISCILLTIIYI